MIAVADTSPVSALLRIGRLDLLSQVFTSVLIPPEVAAELDDGKRVIGDWREDAMTAGISVQPVKDRALVLQLRLSLHAGEAGAIALALETPGATLVIDETDGRNAARHQGLSVTGTLGVVVAAKRRGLLPATRPVIAQLRATGGLWLSESIVRHAIALAGET